MADFVPVAPANDPGEVPRREFVRRLEAPRESGTPLLYPDPATYRSAIVANQRQWTIPPNEGSFNEFHELRRKAIADLLSQAVAYSRNYLNLPEPLTGRIASYFATDTSQAFRSKSHDKAISNPISLNPPIILSGHQPILYHPGVWFKHFVLNSLAERIHAIPVHLIVDNDLAGPATIKVPQEHHHEVRLGTVAIDKEHVEVPFEARKIVERAYFEAFPERLRPALPMIDDPLVGALWNEPVETDNLGQALAMRRHRFETRVGLQTLEVPLSRMCQTESFSIFTSRLILQAREFAILHNQTLAEFRQQHRIRSRAHPFPELRLDEVWIEVPFWIWDHRKPFRRPLFCRQLGGDVTLSDRKETEFRFAAQELSSELLSVMRQGIAIRPRALTTTMFARLFLGDWFLHGLGGAKYDELTDLLIQQFWGIAAPAFGVATATFHLPNTPYKPNLEAQLRDLENTARRIQQQPDRYIDPSDDMAVELVFEKQKLIRNKNTFVDQKQFRQAVADLDQKLRDHMLPKIEALTQDRQQLAQAQSANRIWGARDYSLACFPRSLAHELHELAQRAFENF